MTDARFQFAPELGGSPLIEEECESSSIARRPRAVVAKEQRNCRAQCGSLLCRNKHVQRFGCLETARSHLAASHDVEAEYLAPVVVGDRRQQRQILRLAGRAL